MEINRWPSDCQEGQACKTWCSLFNSHNKTMNSKEGIERHLPWGFAPLPGKHMAIQKENTLV